LPALVSGPGEHAGFAALVGRHLDEDVRRRAESMPDRRASPAARYAVPDETGAQQRRRLRVGVAVRELEHEARVGDGVIGITAIDVISGEARVDAEILAIALAVLALVARIAEPRNPDSIADGEIGHAVPEALDDADNLMARHDRNLRLRQLLDDVQVGPAPPRR
jgi:hypothetical protein